MKRLIALLLGSLMVCTFVFAGCNNNSQPSTEAPTEAASETPAETQETATPEETTSEETTAEPDTEAPDTPVTGGWEVVTDQQSSLTDEETARFKNATAELTGVNYEPVAILATQVVAGTNYAYLCKGTVVYPDAQPSWYIATIYEDLEGNASCIGINEFDIANPSVITEPQGDVVGGWAVINPGENPATLSDEEAQAALDKANEGLEQIIYYPIAVLGKQVVAGMNYKVLAFGASTADSSDVSIYVITIYADLQGNATVENSFELDLTAYTDYSMG